MSPYYFSTLFKRQTGIQLRDYIVQVRIEKAKEFLNGTDKKIMEIAFESGYQDTAHFNRAFKKVVGMSPSQYRAFEKKHNTG